MTAPMRPSSQDSDLSHPPGSWAPARALARRAWAPVERFLAVEAASGVILLVAAALALVWANSPARESYTALWHVPLGLHAGPWSFERDLHFWINDGLMTIFFFVVGLEIRREMHAGELSELRRATLPLAAALGGMLAPALIYTLLNRGLPSAGGWGVPMATDIAFAVGVLALLGKRVPPALRILLLALAVIDDVGAIIVIAVFYSGGLAWSGLGLVLLGMAIIFAMQKLGLQRPALYIAPGLLVWAGAYASGVHPTLAGVVVGLMTPVRGWHGEASPAESLQHGLHSWVAYLIMPLFALANAGVPLGAVSLEGDAIHVFLGVALGLVLGKPLGVLALSWLAVRLRLAVLPSGVSWLKVGLVGVVAGIGFTMALFIAALAFPPGATLETAKLAILVGSGVAAVLGFVAGRVLLPAVHSASAAPTEAEAEASTQH